MTTIHLHFPNGTQSILSGTYSGYEPSRKDKLITAHITTQDGYGLFIDQYTLTLKYKYVTLDYSRFSIGQTVYPLVQLCTFKGTEKKHLTRLRDLRDEVMLHGTVDGEPIPYRLSLLIDSMQ